MLVLSRKLNEVIEVAGPCRLHVLGVHGERVKIGIEAAKEVEVKRSTGPRVQGEALVFVGRRQSANDAA